MPGLRRIAVVAVAAFVCTASPAGAADYCVGVTRDACTAKPSLTEALAAATADPDADRIYLGAGVHDQTALSFSDEGTAVAIEGVGADLTEIDAAGTPILTLSNPLSSVRDVRIAAG